jgi:hypothetical protein
MTDLPLCAEQLALSESVIQVLSTLSDPATGIDQLVACELQGDHPGHHLALCHAYGAAQVWVRWRPGQPPALTEVAESSFCTAEGPRPKDLPDPWLCELPDGHPGAHSFELEERKPRLPSAESRRKVDEAFRQLRGW